MNITIFSKPNCVPCATLKVWLTRKGYEYRERDITEDEEARELIVSAGFMTAPVAKINDRLVVGSVLSEVARVLEEEK